MIPRLGATLLATALVAGCYGGPLRHPLPTLPLGGSGDERLVVLLHGRGGSPEDFDRKGRFADAMQRSGIHGRLVAPDAHLGYYAKSQIVRRLHEDVVAPARERGVREVWLTGISLGGLGALLYLKEHPDELRGAVLLAPYLGDEALIGEIARAGAPRGWTRADLSARTLRRVGGATFQLELWEWILGDQGLALHDRDLYLAWGADDRYAEGHRLLATLLPEGHAFEGPGGHDWRAWSSLWERLLESETGPFVERPR